MVQLFICYFWFEHLNNQCKRVYAKNQDIKHLIALRIQIKFLQVQPVWLRNIQNAMKSWQAAYDDEVAIGELTNTYVTVI